MAEFYSTYVVNCVINALSSCTAIMLNILAIHAMRKTLSLPKPLKALLLSLAVSDLAVGLVAQPFNIGIMVMLLKNTLPPSSTGKLYSFFTHIFSWTSFFNVVAISVDRLLAIQLHLRYQALVTHKRVVAVVISIWVFSIILSSILTFRFIPINEITLVVLAVTMGLCVICTAIIYCKIYITVRRHSKEINGLQVPQQEERNGERVNAARQRKSAVGTFYIYLVFLICYLPEYCRLLLTILLLHNANTIPMVRFYYFSWTLLFLNSSLNPLVYCWKMRNIRRAVMNIMRSMFSKSQGNNATLNSDEGRTNSVPLAVYSRCDSYTVDM
ncbi:melanocortin receptor 5-like [Orbicella faveolata]|uniref:melanocortin receptor 5-like n=1 Tax=Orbicella faveolata TaxID=48498 RepID=UPI0009E4AD87|nr:melanocortin receptor 5-like [Orbicella faveolata]